jgi:hypothetical protein
MKKIILIFFILTSTFSFCQEKINLEKASDNIQKIIDYKLDNSKPNIFISDIETIDSIVKLTKKKYKIIYSFSDRCHSCVEIFPTLVKFISENSEKLELLPIIGHRNKEIPHFVEYLKKVKYFNPMYLLDMEKYGTKKNPFKRIDQLTQKLCKECDYKKMGFSSFYIFDNNNKIVAHNNWDFSWEDQLKQLKQLISEE